MFWKKSESRKNYDPYSSRQSSGLSLRSRLLPLLRSGDYYSRSPPSAQEVRGLFEELDNPAELILYIEMLHWYDRKLEYMFAEGELPTVTENFLKEGLEQYFSQQTQIEWKEIALSDIFFLIIRKGFGDLIKRQFLPHLSEVLKRLLQPRLETLNRVMSECQDRYLLEVTFPFFAFKNFRHTLTEAVTKQNYPFLIVFLDRESKLDRKLLKGIVDTEVARLLVQDERLEIGPNHQPAWWEAVCGPSQVEDPSELLDLLLRAKGPDPNPEYSQLLITAARNGRLKIVERLLKDERVSPTYRGSDCLRKAARAGNLEVVKVLVEDGRVRINDFHDDALVQAFEYGHLDVVSYLQEKHPEAVTSFI